MGVALECMLEPVGRLEEPLGAEVIGMRERRLAEATIAQALVVLCAIFRLARSRKLTRRDPVIELDDAERPSPRKGRAGRALDEQELATLVRHAPAGFEQLVPVLAYSGLRISEALGLRWEDVDLVDGELHVRGQLQPATAERPAAIVPPKTRSGARIVPMMPAVEQALLEQFEREHVHGRGGAPPISSSRAALAGRCSPATCASVASAKRHEPQGSATLLRTTYAGRSLPSPCVVASTRSRRHR